VVRQLLGPAGCSSFLQQCLQQLLASASLANRTLYRSTSLATTVVCITCALLGNCMPVLTREGAVHTQIACAQNGILQHMFHSLLLECHTWFSFAWLPMP
jgi:hypothetical protein